MFCCHFFLFILLSIIFLFFFFNDTATTEIYTLSLHDALPIYHTRISQLHFGHGPDGHEAQSSAKKSSQALQKRSEEHTSELQSLAYLVCRLLLEKKKKKIKKNKTTPKQKKYARMAVRHTTADD